MHISIIPETLFHLGSFTITNTLITSWIVVIALSIGAIIFGATVKKLPGRFQSAVETVIEGLLNFMETVGGSRENARRFFPIVATIFIFVLAANWAGILPGVGSIGLYIPHGEETEFVPLLRSVNSDLNMTIALALIAVSLSHFFGVVTVGLKGHLGKFFNFKNPIEFFVGLLEIIGEGARILSFSFRLFGNVFAGEVLLVIIAFLVPYVIPSAFLGMELFVGFIQALIFATLAMVAFAGATVAHHMTEHAHA